MGRVHCRAVFGRMAGCVVLFAAGGGFAMQAAWADAPRVVSLSPPNGASDVDPGLRQLVIKFDQDMQTTGHSICGGGPMYPKFSQPPAWRDARTLVIRVTLEPDHAYAMGLNCPGSNRWFRTPAGEELPPVEWTFSTAAKRKAKNQKAINERSFDELLSTLREHYSYYDRTGTDWDARAKKVRGKVASAKTTRDWIKQVAAFLAPARDPHLWMQYKGQPIGTFQRKFTANINRKGLEKAVGTLTKVNDNALTAELPGGIFYLNIPSWANKHSDAVSEIEVLIAKHRSAKGMIIDVRGNGGGDETLARRVAAWFIEGEHVYSKHATRVPGAKGGFSPVQDRVIRGNDAEKRYDGPVALLIGPVNMSSCESFIRMMKLGRHVTLVGARTAGSSGNPKSFLLPNDVEIFVPSWKDLSPDGSPTEGKGITPHVVVKAKAAAFEKGDPVLRRALKLLKEPAKP